jgi:hypothetical protein
MTARRASEGSMLPDCGECPEACQFTDRHRGRGSVLPCLLELSHLEHDKDRIVPFAQLRRLPGPLNPAAGENSGIIPRSAPSPFAAQVPPDRPW